MRRWTKRTGIFALVCMMLLGAGVVDGAAQNEDPETEKAPMELMAVDLAILRPMGFAVTLLGTGAFVLSLPFTLGRNVGDAAERFVADPARFTFSRPLGEELGAIRSQRHMPESFEGNIPLEEDADL